MITRQNTILDFLHGFHRKTRRRTFLEMMDASVPWEEWLDLILLYYYYKVAHLARQKTETF